MNVDRLNELRDAGYTGLDRSPGDPLAYWAHGEIVRLRSELARAVEEATRELRQTLSDLNARVAEVNSIRSRVVDERDQLRADLAAINEVCDTYKVGDERLRTSNDD